MWKNHSFLITLMWNSMQVNFLRLRQSIFMSHLYCYTQKYIRDSHIYIHESHVRKLVEAVQILVAVFIHLSHKQFVTYMKDFGHIGCLLCPQSVETANERLDITTILRVLQSWLYFISASCDVSVMSHYKIFFTKPTSSNRLVFDQTCFQELIPIHYLLCSWNLP
jgi:hypothetical protein